MAKNCSRLQFFFTILAILLIVLPAYVLNVGRPSPLRSMESICMQTCSETWIAVSEGHTDALLIPLWNNGQPRLNKPPMLVWLTLGVWKIMGLTPGDASITELALGARMVTIILLCGGLLGIIWIGWRLYDEQTGLLGALICGTFFLMIKQSHYATYDAQMMGWATLGAAAGISAAATREWCRFPLRRWLLCALFMAGAVMTKGPVATVWVLIPVSLAISLLPGKKVYRIAGLILALAAAAMLCAPWFIYTLHHVAGTGAALIDEYKPDDVDQFRPVYYYASIVLLILPWTLWAWQSLRFAWNGNVICASGRAVRRLRIPLLWFLIEITFLCVWPMRHQRYLVPILPSIALMLSVFFTQKLWIQNKLPLSKGDAWPFYTLIPMFIFASFALPLFLLFQQELVTAGILDEIQVAGTPTAAIIVMFFVLLFLSTAGWLTLRRYHWKKTTILIGLWFATATAFMFYGYSLAPHQKYEQELEAYHLRHLIQRTPVYYLPGMRDGQRIRPDDGLAIYAQTIIRPLSADQLTTNQLPDPKAFILADRYHPLRRSLLNNNPQTAFFLCVDDGSTDWFVYRFASLPSESVPVEK